MLKKLKMVLLKKEDDAISIPLMFGMFMLVFVLFFLFMESMHFTTAFSQCDDAVERSVIAVATQNWDNIYQTVREGYAGGNYRESLLEDWGKSLEPDKIMDSAVDILNLEYEDGEYVRKNDDGEILLAFKPQTAEAEIIDVELTDASGNTNVGSGLGLVVKVTYDISVAWMVPGAWDAPPIDTTRTVYVNYQSQF